MTDFLLTLIVILLFMNILFGHADIMKDDLRQIILKLNDIESWLKDISKKLNK
jgi:hypothetical protein